MKTNSQPHELTDFGAAADVSGIERAILANLISYPATRPLALARLRPEWFSDSRHTVLFEAIRRSYQAGHSDDWALILHDLEKRDELDAAGGSLYLTDHLSGHGGIPSAMARHCGVLRQEARRRQQRSVGQRLQALAGRLDVEPQELATQAIRDLQDPELADLDDTDGSAEQVAERAIQTYERAEELARSGRECAGLNTGFHGLNLRLNGLMPAELTVIAARTRVGKSTLAIQIMLNAVRLDQATVGFFTLEMSYSQMGARCATIMAGVDPERQRHGRLTEEERDRYFEAAFDYAKLPITLFQDRSLAAIRARILQLHRERQIKLWIVDHLHRVQGPGEEYERLSRTAEDLANLSVEIDRPILLAAQLNRECDSRPDKRPQLSDLRGSGSIEENLVNAVMIHRPGAYDDLRSRYDKDPVALDGFMREAKLLVEKCRFGAEGAVPVVWVRDLAIFAEPAPEYRSGQEPPEHWNN